MFTGLRHRFTADGEGSWGYGSISRGVDCTDAGNIQLPQELVGAYANRVKANWRQAGWDLKEHEEVLYNIPWAGLRNYLKNKVGPMMPAYGRFDTLNQFFDEAAALEVTHVKNKTLQLQQQQQ